MKFLAVLFFAFVALSVSVSFGQARKDIITTKNGTIYKGIITENIPNDHIKITLADSSVVLVKYPDIVKLNIETAGKNEILSSVDALQMMLYESQRKSPTTAVLLSCLITSVGHAYAGNWGRGLLFTMGRLGGYVIAANSPDKKSDNSWGDKTPDHSQGYYIGVGITLVLAIWEMIDASATAESYNNDLYKKITGKDSGISFNMLPKNKGMQFGISYSF